MTDLDWSARVDDLLADGERVVAREPVGESHVVVTNRRVLTLTPTGSGPNYRSVERPNVDGIDVGRRSTGSLRWPLLLGVPGVALAAVGLTVDLAGLLSVPEMPGGSSLGVGDAIETMQTALALVDDAALALGGLLALVGVALAVRWLRSRERVLVVAVAGGDDLHVPLPPGVEDEQVAAGADPLDPGDQAPADEDAGPVDRVRRAIAEA